MRTVIIVGLPGSGKTVLARTLVEQTCGVLVDDPKSMDEVIRNCAASTLIVTDPHFCLTECRRAAADVLTRTRGVESEWIFFANDPEQCQRNLAGRPEQTAHAWFVSRLSRDYHIPVDACVRPVWRPQN